MLPIVERLSIIVVVIGALVLAVLTEVKNLETNLVLSLSIGLLGTLGLYLLAANELAERRLKRLEQQSSFGSEQLTQSEWYERLLPTLKSAGASIDITHHEPRLPSISGISAKRDSFGMLSKVIKQERALVRMIVAVNVPEKLVWVNRLIDEHRQHHNFSLAHAPIDLAFPAPPVSIQIVDREEVFVIDMSKSHHSASEADIDLYSQDPDVVAQFQRYYDSYWDRCIKLKEGGLVHENNLNALESYFSSEQHQVPST